MKRDLKNRVAASKKKVAGQVRDIYLDVVSSFPLRPLRKKDEFLAAGEILDELIGRVDLTRGQRNCLAALVRFIEDYEKEHTRKMIEKLTPLELLKHLMEENEMTTTDLGYVLGSRGLGSEVLNGKRGLSKMLIGKLSQRFAVDPVLFLGVVGSSFSGPVTRSNLRNK